MAKRKYLPVGAVFSYDGVRLKVVASDYNKAVCSGCWFSDWARRKRGQSKASCYIHGYCCTAHNRKDGRHVIFREMTQDEKCTDDLIRKSFGLSNRK